MQSVSLSLTNSKPMGSRRSSPSLLSPVVLILLLPTLALIFVFLIIPSFVSFFWSILKPASFKKGWDSLNIMLVLVASFLGLFAKGKDEFPSEKNKSKYQPSDPRKRSEIFDRLEREEKPEGSGLRRNSNSYPDLRQAPEWETGQSLFQSFDDWELKMYTSSLRKKDFYNIKMEGATMCPRQSSPSLLNPIVLILLLLTLALIFFFFIIPSFFSLLLIILKPTSIKKGWNSVNIMLVLLAFFFGLFAKGNNDVPPEKYESKSHQLFEYSDRLERVAKPGGSWLRMNSSSYPDLRQVSEWETGVSQFQFFDDFELNMYKSSSFKNTHCNMKDNTVDPFEVPQSPPGPVPPPPVAKNLTPERLVPLSSVLKYKQKEIEIGADKIQILHTSEDTTVSPVRNKKQKTIQKIGDIDKKIHQSSIPPQPFMLLTPPPLRPLPKLFKKGNKNKRRHSVPIPRPPLITRFSNLFKTDKKKNKKRLNHVTTPMPPRKGATVYFSRPPLPPKVENHFNGVEHLNQGGKSSLIRIPSPPLLPPPLPPFPVKEKNFVPQSDFVRIRSMHSSRGSSPDLEDVDLPSGKMEGEDGLRSSVTCRSPDVNVMAELFIFKLKQKWMLEKINSMRKKMDKVP